MSVTRRNILQMVPAVAALSVVPKGSAQTPHHVMIVGGGFAGTTAAKYISMWSRGAIKVTLVEPRAEHVSCIMSNLVLNGQLKTRDLSFDYTALQAHPNVTVVQDRVKEINAVGAEIRLKKNGWQPYDSLVVATGIQFDSMEGLNFKLTPHAWIAGGQTNLLRRQIRDMPDDGTFVMTIPKGPYRCPPGPYERACLVADIVRRRGAGGRVIVLDENAGIQAEKATFERAFNELYGDIVEYRSGLTVDAVDSIGRYVYTSKTVGGHTVEEAVHGDVVNVIPRHGAAKILKKSGLTDGGRWAPVDPATYGSTVNDGVYVIGDGQGTGQPKSGHMANSQAKVCADAIIRRVLGDASTIMSEERLNNITTNSACFSPITLNQASWLTAVFAYKDGAMQLVPGSLGEAHEWSSENYQDMFSWSKNLFADTFG